MPLLLCPRLGCTSQVLVELASKGHAKDKDKDKDRDAAARILGDTSKLDADSKQAVALEGYG